jgi:hypothetical protein
MKFIVNKYLNKLKMRETKEKTDSCDDRFNDYY